MTTNNAITNARALSLAIDFLANADSFAAFLAAEPYECDEANAVIDKLRKMYETATKPRKKPEGETPAHRRNRENAEKLAAMVGDDEILTTVQICEKLGLMYPASATAVMNVGIECGLFEHAPKTKKSGPQMYKLA